MSFEVAAIHATLGFKTQGEQQAIAAADRVTASTQRLVDAQKAIEVSSRSASAQIQAQGIALQEAVGKFNQATAATAAARAELAASGKNVEQLRANIAALSASVDVDTKKLASMRAELASLTAALDAAAKSGQRLDATEFQRFFALPQEIGALEGQVRGRSAELAQLRGLEAGVSGADVVKAEAQMERLTGTINKQVGAQNKLEGSNTRLRRGLRLNQTSIAGFVSAMRTGNIGSSVLSQGIFGLSSALGPLGIAVGLVAIGIAGLAVKLVSMADAAAQAHPKMLALASSLDRVQGTSLVELASQLEVVSNRLKSFGSTQPTGATTAIAELAEQLQFLRPGAGDFTSTLDAIARSIEQINTTGLADFGVDVQSLNAELKSLAEQGFGEGAQRAAIYAAIQKTVAMNSRAITEQANAERNSLGGIAQEFKNLFTAAAQSGAVQQAVALLADAVRDLLVAVKPLIPAFSALTSVGVFVFVAALKLAALQVYGLLKAFQGLLLATKGLASLFNKDWGERLQKGADNVGAYADEIGRAISTTDELTKSLNTGKDAFFDFGEQGAAAAVDKVRELRDSISGGYGIVGSIRSVAEAWHEMQDDLSPRTAFATIEAMDQAMGLLAEHGTASLDKLSAQFTAALRGGLIDEATFNQLQTGLQTIKDAAGPLQEEVKRVEDALGEGQTAAQNAASANNGTLTPSIYGVGDAASVVTGQVNTLTGAVQNLQIAAGRGVSINAFGITTSFGDTSTDRFAPSTRVPSGRGSRPDSSLGFRFPEGPSTHRQPAFDDSLASVFDAFKPPPSPGGGGGGGGKSLLASIEEIRELFRQINTAILAGIRGGVIFSTAGNAIPAGGVNEFLNTKGGTLISTVNIRGIWDFSDPGAKRQIIRELEEALRDLKREK